MSNLRLDASLSGNNMREELIRLYNELVYWSFEHVKWDTEKKRLESIFKINSDHIKRLRSEAMLNSGKNQKEKEFYVNDIWDTLALGEGTMQKLQEKLNKAASLELETRHNMNLCEKAIDVARTALAWQRAELLKMGETT